MTHHEGVVCRLACSTRTNPIKKGSMANPNFVLDKCHHTVNVENAQGMIEEVM